MSNKNIPDYSIVPTEILSDPDITHRSLKVYIAIKSFMYLEGQGCYLQRSLIAEISGIPISRVSVETGLLERLGWIKKSGGLYEAFSKKHLFDVKLSADELGEQS